MIYVIFANDLRHFCNDLRPLLRQRYFAKIRIKFKIESNIPDKWL